MKISKKWLKENSRPWDEVRKEHFTSEQIFLTDLKVLLLLEIRKIYKARKERNLTQQQLAKVASVPRTTISKIESGSQNFSIMKLNQVANAMDLAVEINLIPLSEMKKRITAYKSELKSKNRNSDS